MQLKDHDEDDAGKKVWLTGEEVDLLIGNTDDTAREIAIGLGVRCGLRAKEIVEITPTDLVEGPAGEMVRVWAGKGEKYRETPVPRDLSASLRAYADVRDESADVPLVDVTTRTVGRWVGRAADRCRAETNDVGWRYLSPHDLRRTWGTLLVQNNVEASLVMEWGGWDNFETFKKHYLTINSPELQRQEREKVEWL